MRYYVAFTGWEYLVVDRLTGRAVSSWTLQSLAVHECDGMNAWIQ